MTRAFLTLALAAAGIGLASVPAAGPALAAGMDGAAHPAAAKGPARPCLPVVRDYLWLDYARMGMGGMGMNRPRQEDRNAADRTNPAGKSAQAQGQNRTWSRRMRMVRLRHDGFPDKVSGGCPSCRAQARVGGAMWRRKAGAGVSDAQENGARSSRRAQGTDPAVRQAVIWLETPDNLIHRIDPGQPGRLRFNARMWGQYRVFAYLDAGVRNGVRRLHFAFLDLFAHGDDVSKQERSRIDGNGYADGRPVFFLERVYENERQRYIAQTGEEARFRLTLNGRPVKGACVVMITQKDWRQAKRTDENGEVSFFLIKETPNESGWRARRRSEKYLVVAQHFEPAAEAGAKAGAETGIKGTRYVATQLLRVRPSRLEWESKSTAFLLASFTAVAAGAAIAIRRVRRRRCKREGGR